MSFFGQAAQMPTSSSQQGPVSNSNYSTSTSRWSPMVEAWVVIGAFFVGFLLLLGWHGVGIKLDAGLGR